MIHPRSIPSHVSDLWRAPNSLVVVCAAGLVPQATDEVRGLGYPVEDCSEAFILTRGTMTDAMRLNLWLRSAQRVLWPLRTLRAETLQQLYEAVFEIPWEDLLDADGRFSVSANVWDVPSVRDSRIPALKAKDAIADRFRRARGSRPDSDNTFEGAAVYLYWRGDDLRVCLDTTGEPLSRRGYRLQPGPAPMQEALAAGCVLASKWDPPRRRRADGGSGTPAIEAALNRAPPRPGAARGFRLHGAQRVRRQATPRRRAASSPAPVAAAGRRHGQAATARRRRRAA